MRTYGVTAPPPSATRPTSSTTWTARAHASRTGSPRRAGSPRPPGAQRLEEAARRTRLVQRRSAAPTRRQLSPGGTVTERWLPVRRVGLYVPGGLLAYPSSVVMNVVPAQVAGVGSFAVASPPQKDQQRTARRSDPRGVRAARHRRGARGRRRPGDRDVRLWTEDCEPTDLVSGPGNVYVASAKRLLKG